MAEFQTFTDGRVQVHVMQHDRFRTKDLSIRLHIPMQRERVTKIALLAHMWMNGTRRFPTTRDLSIAADDLYGTILRTSLGKRGPFHVLEVNADIPDVSGFTEQDIVGRAIDLSCQVLLDHEPLTAAFSKEAVLQEVDLHRRRIEAARDDKMSFALQRCMAEVCQGTPAEFPRLGYLEDLPKMTSDTLFSAFESLLQQANVHVYLVGPYEEPERCAKQIFDRLVPAFSQQRSSTEPTIFVDALPLQGKTDFRRVQEYEDTAQGQLDIGYRTGIDFADEAYPALVMMNGVFGGFAHSKLFANVREKHSLAYTVWSHVDAMTGVLAVMTGIDPANHAKTVEIIEAQLDALRNGDITDDELTFTARGLQNQYTVLLDQPSALANWHYHGVISGRHREMTGLLDELRRMTKDDIARVASTLEPNTIYFLSAKGDSE